MREPSAERFFALRIHKSWKNSLKHRKILLGLRWSSDSPARRNMVFPALWWSEPTYILPPRSAVDRGQRSPLDTALKHTACLRSRRGSVPLCSRRRSAAAPMAGLAPSAGNKQPWRAVACGDKAHFYEKKTKALSNHPPLHIRKRGNIEQDTDYNGLCQRYLI